MLVPFADVKPLVHAILEGCGASSATARLQADTLLEAELRGLASHGLQRLPRMVRRIRSGLADPHATGAHVWRRPGFLSVDGCRGLGPVVGAAAIEALAPVARRDGIALAAVRNSNHLGMLAWYAERIAALGLVGIVLSTSEALVHPFGGRRAMLGTNPVAIGVPVAGGEPFVLDLATSMVSMGKVHDFALRGRAIPEDWARNADGEPTADPDEAMRGSLAPFGGAKGYGLGLAFELLVASLAGSDFAPDVRGTLDAEHPCNKGDVFLLIDPLGGSGRAVAAYLDALRSSPSASPSVPISVPGDGSRARRRQALARGIDVADAVWNQLTSLAGHPA
ncbi:Ldh family oxidoreductase [Aureimonas sp. AU22]|uniref:Ldh family oxidoreductase n=1 Tax=Aureimonas sp. AU22 TaxID=1638162 RepID=UPI0007820333|nr:Ldh family oxidoreductase [Aureimonas sp. AU22]